MSYYIIPTSILTIVFGFFFTLIGIIMVTTQVLPLNPDFILHAGLFGAAIGFLAGIAMSVISTVRR